MIIAVSFVQDRGMRGGGTIRSHLPEGIVLPSHPNKLVLLILIMIGVGGEKASRMSTTQGHLITFRWFRDEKWRKRSPNVQIIANHLEGPNIAQTIWKHLRWREIKNS